MTTYRVITKKSATFFRDEAGIVAPIFGLMAIVLFASMGAAVDYSRWMHARNQTITAMDAAVLAGGKALQNGDSNAVVLAAADSFYATNKSEIVSNDTIDFVIGDDNKSINATGNAIVVTPFLRLLNIEDLPVLAESGVDHSKSELQVGGNAEKNIEIAVMLDVTGSMSGDKLEDMQSAAKTLVNTVIWDDQSEYTSRVSLIPFSQAVNVGATYFNAITNAETSWTVTQNDLPEQSVVQKVLHAAVRGIQSLGLIAPAVANNGNGNGNSNGNSGGGSSGGDDDDNNSGGGSSNNYSSCIVERISNNALSTDDAPGSGKYFQVYDVAKQSNDWTQDSSCKPADVVIEPLTSDKTALTTKIDSFVAAGYTAGHIGTAMAWATLSPNWSGVWGSDRTGAEYSDADTEKYAILMTDGDFNTYYNNASNGDSGEQAEDLCTAMKAAGITVYTVAFEVDDDSDAAEVMENCATDAGSYYDADSGEELEQAFRDIALRISDLRLTH
jgi:Flp pilus assembly protein TadG